LVRCNVCFQNKQTFISDKYKYLIVTILSFTFKKHVFYISFKKTDLYIDL
jgi:hypothetical protein